MTSEIQVISFIVSFIYGIFFYLLARFNKFILSNRKDLFKLVITVIFVIDIVILYIYIMFKVNNGIIHPYFVAIIIIGYYLMARYYERLINLCKICVKKLKTLK